MGHLPSQVVEVPSLGGFAPTLALGGALARGVGGTSDFVYENYTPRSVYHMKDIQFGISKTPKMSVWVHSGPDSGVLTLQRFQNSSRRPGDPFLVNKSSGNIGIYGV